MAEQYNEVTNRLVSTRNVDNPAVNHIVTGSDAVYDDNYPLLVNGYIECDTTPISDPTGNPHEQGWCEEEIVEGEGTGKYILTEDITVELGKSYYKPIGARQDAINNQLRTTISDLSGVVLHANEYNEATIHEGDNPQANGWYELSGTTYVLTTDTTVVSGKTYYIRVAKITSNEDKIIGKEDGYIPTAGAVGRAMGANFEDNLQSTSTVKGLTANMGRALNENKADINGYYETMSVGSAKNLDGETINSEAYLIRPTGGENNEVVSGLASVVGMEGNSQVWNQYITNGDFGTKNLTGWTTRDITSSVVDGVLHINFTAQFANITQNITKLVGHKVYIKIQSPNSVLKLKAFWACFLNLYNQAINQPIVASNNFRYIYTIPSNAIFFGIVNTYPSSVSDVIFDSIQIIDLTLLGIDNLTTVAEVEAWLAQHVGTKPYYVYNAGTILSAQTLGIKIYSRNLLNPSNGLAKLIPYNHTTNSNKYTVKGIPTGAAVTYTPDNTGVAVDVTSAITDNTFDISSYGIGTLYIPNATANTYVCMKYDGTMDDKVVPYKENTYNFDVRNVYGKTGGSDEYVQCFPNGMMSADNTHDILSADMAVSNVDKQYLSNFGQWNWNPNQLGFSSSTLSKSIIKTRSSGLVQMFCSMYLRGVYTTSNSDIVNAPNLTINFYNNVDYDRLTIKDSRYNAETVENFRNSIANVELIFERQYPVTYTDLIYRDGGIDKPLREVLVNLNVDNWSMEEQLVSEYDAQGNPTSVPATVQTKYSIDAVEAIKTLEEASYFESDIHDNLQAMLTCINTNCASVLGGQFSISETATNKLFNFTFTANASTNSTEENTETI